MSGLTIDNPITLAEVLKSQRVIPGDVITLADGTYTGPFKIDVDALDGTAENPITIKATNPHKAIIDGYFDAGGNYVILQDLQFSHSWSSREVSVFPTDV